uniref:Uncharacterized protein n=1 Tax=Aegilops tauschii subsp. strangulata TaxID=200361 RepID=A0A453BAF3_AEGTS
RELSHPNGNKKPSQIQITHLPSTFYHVATGEAPQVAAAPPIFCRAAPPPSTFCRAARAPPRPPPRPAQPPSTFFQSRHRSTT